MLRDALTVVNDKVRMSRTAFVPLIRPVMFERFFFLLGGLEVEDLHGGLLGREVPAVTDRPPEPGVERLDRVGIRYEISGRPERLRGEVV
jgi:hypothetical protein